LPRKRIAKGEEIREDEFAVRKQEERGNRGEEAVLPVGSK
jgi:hypothetical protein